MRSGPLQRQAFPSGRAHPYRLPAALHRHQLVALLVDEKLAVDALVTLSAETPDAVCADGTVCPLWGWEERKWSAALGSHEPMVTPH